MRLTFSPEEITAILPMQAYMLALHSAGQHVKKASS
jgi:hypothetical protein